MRDAPLARLVTSFAIQVALGIALTTTPARAGDPPAHQEAARRASVAVAQQFPHGVGGPEFTIDPNALWSGGDVAMSPVNAPDLWGCEQPEQPPAVTAANDAVVGSITATLANQLNLALPMFAGQTYPVAMTCNYNHFVENAALASVSEAGAVQRMYQDYAYDTYIRGAAYCSADEWHDYWRAVLYGLHFVQDAQAEQHQVGNRWCTGASPVFGTLATGPVGLLFKFQRSTALAAAGALGHVVDDTCQDFIASATGAYASGALDCDAAVSGGIVAGLGLLCSSQLAPPACMGLERVLRHHCNYGGDRPTPRKVDCAGALAPQCNDPSVTCVQGGSTTYCEGELCLGGGVVDYVGAATAASIPYLTQMANKWAAACGCGGGPACEAGEVCLRCNGIVDGCEAQGSSCCGNAVCGAGEECCAAAGAPSCVTAGSCCGDTVCASGQICLNCPGGDAGTGDAGAHDAGKPDARMDGGAGRADSTCPPAAMEGGAGAPDAGAAMTVSRQGSCVAAGTSCPGVDAGVDAGNMSCIALGTGPCARTSDCCPGPGIECGTVNGGGIACAQVPGYACTGNNECSFGALTTDGGAGIGRYNQCNDGECCVATGDCVASSDCCDKTQECAPTAPYAFLGCCYPAGAACKLYDDPNVPGDCCGNMRCDPGSHTCVCTPTGGNCWETSPGCCNGTCPGDGNGCP